MLIRISLILELISVIICVYCVNGKKIKLDVGTIAFFIVLLVMLDYFNRMQISGPSKAVIYVIIYAFCKFKFGTNYIGTGISILLLMIVLAAIQFICLLFAAILVPEQEKIRTILGNVFTLFICVSIVPKCRLDRLKKNVLQKWKFVKFLFVFILVVIIVLLLQNYIAQGIYVEPFLFAIPSILLLLVMLGKWSSAQIKVENMQNELETNKSMQEKYEELLTKVRMHQHEFKNHLTAIFSTHYTYNTYEKLVRAQTEYCNKLQQENKYNNLLILNSNVLAGFLYGKFQDVENDGITIEYSIKSSLEALSIHEYYLIEILGILLDNAVEAVDKNNNEKKIFFTVTEEGDKYLFSIRNRYPYVPYEKIEKWFMFENSEKGHNRGIGLYHAKTLCDEWNSNIGCRNVSINEENWIELILEVDKAGS